jgi:hypothetical protein
VTSRTERSGAVPQGTDRRACAWHRTAAMAICALRQGAAAL